MLLRLLCANAVDRIEEFVSYRPFMLERSSMMHVTNYASSFPLIAEQPWILPFTNKRESQPLVMTLYTEFNNVKCICFYDVTWCNLVSRRDCVGTMNYIVLFWCFITLGFSRHFQWEFNMEFEIYFATMKLNIKFRQSQDCLNNIKI